MQRPVSTTQRITMVTAIRRLRGVRLGQRGGLERQLTEESALTLDDSTDSSPQGSAGPAIPRGQGLYGTGMWLATLFLRERSKGIEART